MYVELGKILGQHEAVFQTREAIAAQKKVAETAAAWARGYGMYEDCGESYCEDKRVQENILEYLIRLKINQEKYLKKIKYEFKEAYPEFDLAAFLVESHKGNKSRVRP